MKSILLVLFLFFSCSISYAQNNDFPITGDATIHNYSPLLILKRNTDIGGFVQGIQTRLMNGTDNWFFGNHHDGKWIVSKGNYDDPKLVIQSDGYVGIGTTSPTAKLAVNGDIRAREIKVENGNWPDYVFAKSYVLPGLIEIEAFIQEKGHLPGIPSAKEVAMNGVDLGEMNAKLLQKIEELTLHLIQNEKALKAQADRIKKLEEANSSRN